MAAKKGSYALHCMQGGTPALIDINDNNGVAFEIDPTTMEGYVIRVVGYR